ncbi:MAG: CHAT domain-containing protein [Leptolyngbyaceae cyanobacterium RU_5_1]|nr:CHAT domain-containing protein [Leptolyngbyaceae cyanobacterium RU_5_1]
MTFLRFDKALHLFKRLRWGGVAVFLALLLSAALFPPAFAYITTGNSVAQEQSTSEQIEQQARQLYETGSFSEAVNLWQQAIAAFKTRGDTLGEAMALSNLSLTYQQLGQWEAAEKAILESLNLLRSRASVEHQRVQNPKSKIQNLLAQALDVQGRLQFTQGNVEAALATWQQAADRYAQLRNQPKLTRNRINQTQALQALGLYRQAQKILSEANQTLQREPDSLLKATGLRSLGNALQVTGDLEQSRQVLQQSLGVAQAIAHPHAVTDALLSLGNTVRAQGDSKAALQFYQQAASIANASPTTRIQAQLNQLSLLLNTQQWQETEALQSQIQAQIESLPASRAAIYARVNFAQSLMRLGKVEEWEGRESRGVRGVSGSASSPSSPLTSPSSASASSSPSSPTFIAQLLANAVQQARSLGDKRAEAYALGRLGQLYEQNGQRSQAQDLTRQALLTAQAVNAPDVTYQWQWQLGRLLRARVELEGTESAAYAEAIAAYDSAVKTLQSLRYDLVAMNPDVQFSFREEVEPVYREFVDLLLRPIGDLEPSPENLYRAREVVELLQIAELNNFFREPCLEAKREIDRVVDQQERVAAIYPIILANRLEVILKLPQQPLQHYVTTIPQTQVQTTLEQLRSSLVEPDKLRRSQALAQTVYDWLIRPVEATLAHHQVQTLVFILDGELRNIPMTALYDGNQYLVEKYSIALTPGLQLIEPSPIQQIPLKAIAAGVSEGRPQFDATPLPNVVPELEMIQSLLPSQVLLNQGFTSAALQDRVRSLPFPVLHLATHGKFSSNANQTYIVAWDKPIYVNELDHLLKTRERKQPFAIELLVLSACQTAKGDKRAALGLAGVAVRAGARSTLASLWNVNDESTALLMSQFYQALANKSLTKAEALRQAQLTLLKHPTYRRPMFWAPYVLVGNWL